MKRRFVLGKAFAALICASLLVSGCGSSSKSSSYDTVATESAYEEAALYDNGAEGFAEKSAEQSAESVQDTSRKLIKTVNLEAETDDLDRTVANVEAKVNQLGGYIENSNIYKGAGYSSGRDANITARIPAEHLDEFVENVEESSNITRKSVNVDDVTLQYVDINSRKSALKTEESRLLEILSSAESVEDLITVENRLADVRYELESIESQIRSYDNQVDYSTVNLSISEVVAFTPVEKQKVSDRISEGFMKNLHSVLNGIVEFFIFLLIHIPQLVLLALFVILIIVITKLSVKRSNAKRAKMAAQRAQMYQGSVLSPAPDQQTPQNTGNQNEGNKQ
ncbi:MAG: DUF4349 domain-containing protein [Butyrivibrio sp.]|nr:DUF4349 domain-containing protein [Butyrivibrio sp.]